MNCLSPLLCAALIAWGPWAKVAADHPTVALGSEQGGALNTISAASLPAGAWAVALRTELVKFDALSDASLTRFADDVHSIDEIVSASAVLIYGVSDDLDVSIRFPWVWRDNIREGEITDGAAEIHTHGNASGFGDLLVWANYRFYSVAGFDLALQGGVKTPTGQTDGSDLGERLESEFQSGTGSWDFLIGGALSKNYGQIGVHANVLFDSTTKGSDASEFGDALLYNLAIVFSPETDHDHGTHQHQSPLDEIRWELVLEVNGEMRWKDRLDGRHEVNSGGNRIYLSPGLRVSFKQASAFVSVGYPVVDDANGWQSDIELRIVGGVAIGF